MLRYPLRCASREFNIPRAESDTWYRSDTSPPLQRTCIFLFLFWSTAETALPSHLPAPSVSVQIAQASHHCPHPNHCRYCRWNRSRSPPPVSFPSSPYRSLAVASVAGTLHPASSPTSPLPRHRDLVPHGHLSCLLFLVGLVRSHWGRSHHERSSPVFLSPTIVAKGKPTEEEWKRVTRRTLSSTRAAVGHLARRCAIHLAISSSVSSRIAVPGIGGAGLSEGQKQIVTKTSNQK
jgi:hypothetical protein